MAGGASDRLRARILIDCGALLCAGAPCPHDQACQRGTSRPPSSGCRLRITRTLVLPDQRGDLPAKCLKASYLSARKNTLAALWFGVVAFDLKDQQSVVVFVGEEREVLLYSGDNLVERHIVA